MFKRDTLFIVGAGASQEVGFPLGTELAKLIGSRLVRGVADDGRAVYADPEFFDQIHRTFPKYINEFYAAAQRITEGIQLTNSIDDFLNVHSADDRIKTVGKAAVIRSILRAERESDLFVDRSNINNKIDFDKITDTWFVKLIRVLGPDVTVERVESLFDKVSFIVFNYDRCLEHFLFYALQALYGITADQANSIVAKISIVHPYGSIGNLNTVPFGGSVNLFKLTSQIRTYTEQIEDGTIVDTMHEMMHQARCIVFLGFSYGEQNMELLKPKKAIERKPVFGTAYGLSMTDREVVSRRIFSMMKELPAQTVERDNLVELGIGVRCAGLFDNYTRSLNAA